MRVNRCRTGSFALRGKPRWKRDGDELVNVVEHAHAAHRATRDPIGAEGDRVFGKVRHRLGLPKAAEPNPVAPDTIGLGRGTLRSRERSMRNVSARNREVARECNSWVAS